MIKDIEIMVFWVSLIFREGKKIFDFVGQGQGIW